MKSFAEALKNMKTGEWAPHELAATVNEIIKVVGTNSRYNYGYWLSKVKRSGKSYNEMLGILKEVGNMDLKYSKGGRLTNILTNKKK